MLSLLCILRPKFAAPSKATESVAVLIRDGISNNSSDIFVLDFDQLFNYQYDGNDFLQ